MKLGRLLALAVLGLSNSLCVPVFAQGYKIKTIVVDAGHGGFRGGASGKFSNEKNVALKVALKLGDALSEAFPGMKIIQTRKTDVDVDWYKRAEIANDAKADLFISIHCNSMPRGNNYTKGVETFVGAYRRINEMDAGLKENEEILEDKSAKKAADEYMDPSEQITLNLYKQLYRSKSLKLAELIQKNYTEGNKRVNRGVKEQGILILQRAAMPSVLTEIGFISTPSEEAYINSAAGQEEIVNSIVNAVREYKKQVEN